MLSWRLTSDFNTQKHLFFKKIETDYLIDTFICSCSHVESVVKHPGQSIEYTCSECENRIFYDANRALRNIENFISQNSEVESFAEYISYHDDDKISSCYIIKIPKSINFSSNTVNYTDQTIYSLILQKSGDIEENIYLEPNIVDKYKFVEEDEITLYSTQKKPSKKILIYKKLRQMLTKQINVFCFNVPKPKNAKLTINQAELLLVYPHLKEFDFYYWEQRHELPMQDLYIEDALTYISNYRKEKSIKKALYENYVKQLTETSEFNSFLIQSIIKNIEDVNLVVTFLKYEFKYPQEVGIATDTIDTFINFLKQYYSQKQIVKFFMDYKGGSQEYLFRDTVYDLEFNLEIIEHTFNKVACKMNSIHDEFVKCVSEERYKYIYDKPLSYQEKHLKPCVSTNSYSVKLPHSGKELFQWAEMLHNCISSYFDMINEGKTIIYGFFQNDALIFAAEIQNNKMIQYSAKYNVKLRKDELELLDKWFEMHFKSKVDDKNIIE